MSSSRDTEWGVQNDGLKLTSVQLQSPQTRRASAAKRRTVKLVVTLAVLFCVAAAIMVAVMTFGNTARTGVAVPDRFVAQYRMHRLSNPDYKYVGQLYRDADGPDGNWNVEARVTYFNPRTNVSSTITLLDGRVYYTSTHQGEDAPFYTGCYPDFLVPPLADIDDVLRNAAPLPDGALASVSGACADGSARYAIQWGEDPGDGENTYFYCQDGTVHRVSGDNFQADIWDFDASPPTDFSMGLTIPKDRETGSPLECPLLPRNRTALAATLEENEAHRDAAVGRLLRAEQANEDKEAPTRRRLNGRTCYFVHSFSQNSNKNTANSWAGYWGDVDDVVGSQCSSTKFVKNKVRNKGWDDPGVMDAICDDIAGGHQGKWFSNKIIFTHGSGSLSFAAALMSQRCKKGANVDWYSIAAPWEGADTADDAQWLCKNKHSSTMEDAYKATGMCKNWDSSSDASASVLSLKTTYSSDLYTMAQLKSFAASKLSGSLCGLAANPDPILEIDSYVYFAGENDNPYNSDGLTHIDSCKAGQTFGTKYTHSNAALMTNYLTMTCRDDDPLIDSNMQASPCKWFKYRTN